VHLSIRYIIKDVPQTGAPSSGSRPVQHILFGKVNKGLRELGHSLNDHPTY
jgi:hypothetical protein